MNATTFTNLNRPTAKFAAVFSLAVELLQNVGVAFRNLNFSRLAVAPVSK